MALIALLLPPGGAALTVRNLQRLGDIDETSARWLTVAVTAVFALGYAALIVITVGQSQGKSVQSADASATVLDFGVGLASYIVQRLPYRHWRGTHHRAPTGSLVSALAVVAIYGLVSYAGAIILSLAVMGALQFSGTIVA